MATPYEVDITMDQTTLTTLRDEGYALYGFKAVKTATQGGSPLVWIKTTAYLTVTAVKWTESYQAYISQQEITAGVVINSQNNIAIELDQTADVSNVGALSVELGGDPNGITITNQGRSEWVCGISQLQGGIYTPMCAFPLHGLMLDVIEPIEKVMFMFATNTQNTGTVIYKSYSSGVMIDLTQSQTRGVTFGINDGWSWGSGTWAKEYVPNTALVPILIESS